MGDYGDQRAYLQPTKDYHGASWRSPQRLGSRLLPGSVTICLQAEGLRLAARVSQATLPSDGHRSH